MKKSLLIVIVVVLVAIVGFSAYHIITGMMVYQEIDEYYETVDQLYVTEVVVPSSPQPSAEPSGKAENVTPEESTVVEESAFEEGAEALEEQVVEMPPIQVDFETLLADAPDTVGWLYGLGGEINLPVVQGEDNQYYLRRLPNGEYSYGGSLFLDYLASPDFSDTISFIYGHNMRNGSMLQPITAYQKQSCYDEYPVMYLLTPSQNYKMEVFSGYITDIESDAYTFQFVSDEEKEAYIQMLLAMSDFSSGVEVTAADEILCLSTCTYQYEDARFVLFAKLTPI